MGKPLIKNYNPRTHKLCIKCRIWKPRKDIFDDDVDKDGDAEGAEILEKHGFGKHDTSSDGLQSICFACKNIANNAARNRNVTARIRHHTATRCLTQLGDLAPAGFTKDLEMHLGYKITKLIRHLQKDLQEREGGGTDNLTPRGKEKKISLRKRLDAGYHIDHKRPLSLYGVVVDNAVDWEEFRKCWAMENLSAIPGKENLAKGATYEEETAVPPPPPTRDDFIC